MTQPASIIGCDTGSMMRANESDFYFAIQQRQFAAKMTNRVYLRLLRRITEMFHYRVSQIECCYEFCARLFANFDRVTDVIFKVRQQQQFVMKNVYTNPVEHFKRINSMGVAASPAAQEVRAERAAMAEEPPAAERENGDERVATIVNEAPKVGRNDPCPCGSGKKYKQCCGKEA